MYCLHRMSPTLSLIFCLFLSRSTILIKLNTDGQNELRYSPGDHLGVFPCNREELVQALLERVEDPPPANDTVQVETMDKDSNLRKYELPPARGSFPLGGHYSKSLRLYLQDWGLVVRLPGSLTLESHLVHCDKR